MPPDHPLRRASEAVAYTRRQCLHVAAVLTGSVIALIQADQWAMPLAYCAGGVLIVLVALLFGHVQSERDCALALIIDGHEGLAIAPVQRQQKRLLAQRNRGRLIDELEEAVQCVRKPTRRVALTPPL